MAQCYWSLFENSMDAVFLAEADGRVLAANPAAERMFGYTEHEIIQLGQTGLVDGSDPGLALALAEWEHAGHFRGELKMRRKGGGMFPAEICLGVFNQADGRRVLSMCVRDVTDRILAEEELLAAKAAADHANAAKSRFLAAASHDLRQPMQALRLYVDLLREQAPDVKVQTLSDLMDKALRGAEELLHSLLDISKLEAGLVKVERQSISVAKVLNDLAAQYADMGAWKGVRLKSVPSSAVVDTDPVLLARVLRNLLDNAIKHAKGGRVLLGCRRIKEGVRIEVWDTGLGIPPDQLLVIFEDFYQVGNPNRDPRNGFGIGLGVARRTAEMLGHKITVRSWPGKGSVFAVQVPFAGLSHHPGPDE